VFLIAISRSSWRLRLGLTVRARHESLTQQQKAQGVIRGSGRVI